MMKYLLARPLFEARPESAMCSSLASLKIGDHDARPLSLGLFRSASFFYLACSFAA